MLAKVTPPCCTATGTLRLVVELSPSWPLPLAPQQYAWPAEVSPQLCVPAALIAVKVTPPCCTATGYLGPINELLPTAPSPPYPQHHAWPVLSSAQLCVLPAT